MERLLTRFLNDKNPSFDYRRNIPFEKTADIYSERQNNLSFTITPPGDAHDFCKVESAFTRSKNRRSERQKQKFLSFTISIANTIRERCRNLLKETFLESLFR